MSADIMLIKVPSLGNLSLLKSDDTSSTIPTPPGENPREILIEKITQRLETQLNDSDESKLFNPQ